MTTILSQSTGLLKCVSLSVAFVAATLSSIATTWLCLWLLFGGTGMFRVSFGENRQYIYFAIVIVTISLTVCVGALYRERAFILIGLGAVGGYVGSVLAYYVLAFEFVERMVLSNYLGFLVAPLVLPTHFIFVASGALAGGLVLILLTLYKAWRSIS
ncbi:hypothetical protein [Bradyrhizobium sp.]|uniref:hypothetical protein n=1 Tax=Bradyrhizobium sp. TaxID=376 RepID=UPI003C75A454